jgi:hypothetical protein
MDISLGLGGATPGLLGDSHLSPMGMQQGGWRHHAQQQQTPLQQQQQQQQHLSQQQQQSQQYEMVPESPEEGRDAAAAEAAGSPADGETADLMDVDEMHADENAPPASPAGAAAAAAAAAAGGGEVDGLTTNLLLDDHRQLAGWGHVPLGARPSLGGAGGGLTTHTGRGSVGSNVLTMHTVSRDALCSLDASPAVT